MDLSPTVHIDHLLLYIVHFNAMNLGYEYQVTMCSTKYKRKHTACIDMPINWNKKNVQEGEGLREMDNSPTVYHDLI